MYNKHIKRFFDIIISSVILIILLWLFILIALLVKATSKGPVLFRQKRIGVHKREFYMYKFRTMYITAPSEVATHELTKPEQYITPIGKFLRKSSLDELPQLINILLGHMSFVGPRPALWNQYDLISERDKYNVNDVRPGLTGWAQVNGRDELPIHIKAKYDGEYVNELSFLFDCKCIYKTVFCVVRQDGIKEGT